MTYSTHFVYRVSLAVPSAKGKMDSGTSTHISTFMKRLLLSYEALRGKSPGKNGLHFWDAVAISAADEEQAKSFRLQISKKKKLLRLPDVPYHVVPDLPGTKMGTGGSTLHILRCLEEIYGDRLFELKIMLIHAGGQSKRLPSHSVLGKLFTPLPVPGPTVFDMLDLKLAMYLPFLALMAPGIFLTCSDDVETYVLDICDTPEKRLPFGTKGFTALAHPSPISVGMTHGVYILPPVARTFRSCAVTTCLEVLQKPSEGLMRSRGAVVKTAERGSKEGEYVYTDSAFFFDADVTKKMLMFYETAKPIRSEIDAYRDFLQKLGSRSRAELFDKGSAGDAPTLIQDVLAEFPLNVVVIPKSRFYHIGTMTEYIDNLCTDQQFAEELGLSRFTNSRVCEEGNAGSPTIQSSDIRGVIMHSKIHRNSFIGATVVIEYCKLTVPIHVQQNCIVSNCEVTSTDSTAVEIPSESLFFTANISTSSISGFVTVAFGIGDDLKYSRTSKGDLLYFGMPLRDISKRVRNMEDAFDETLSCFSLWEAKLFEVKPTMTGAFSSTLSLVRAVTKKTEKYLSFQSTVSMKDVLDWKCIEKMLEYQDSIFA